MKRIYFILGIVAALCLSVQAQHLAPDFPNWSRAEKMSADSLEKCMEHRRFYPSWIEGTSSFYYYVKEGDVICHYLVNAKTGKRTNLIKDNERFVQQYAAITGDTLDKNRLFIYGYRFKDKDLSCFYLRKKGKLMKYDIRRGQLYAIAQPLTSESKRLRSIKTCHSSDSLFTMMGGGYDLFIRDNRDGSVSRVTADGKEDAAYTYRFSRDTLPENSRGFWLGHRYVQLMQDMSQVEELSLIHSLTKQRPKISSFKMPMPGDAGVRQYHLYWYDADRKEGKRLPIYKYPDQTVELNYYRSMESLYFVRKSRKADRVDLCRVNVQDGSITELISEECKPHMNLSLFNYHIIEDGKFFIWWSERTGKGNYYLYDSQGKLLNRITQGEALVAGNVLHIDTLRRSLIFAGYGNERGINPYYRFYYRVNWNGTNQQLLTPGNGTHELKLSDDKQYAVDVYSRMDMASVMQTVSVAHPNRCFQIDQVDLTELKNQGWIPPTMLKLKAADGVTDLYGLMYVPTDLDSNKKYPIISNVYPGPQDDQIPHSFTLDDNGNQSLAELGFVVINVAARGSSPLRGRDFYTFGYGNLRDYPLADDKHVIQELGKMYSFIDLDRVGIYGHSGGAFQTVAAMLTYPDFYKVGVAASGNYDNNIYIQWWGETFHGLEEKIDKKTGKTVFSIQIPTNMELAKNLKGRLMLLTGDVDKNVPPSCTYRMANALIQANKRFDMFVLPGKDHGVMCPYYQNLIRYYFVENLLQPTERHIDIVNHSY